MSDSCLMIMHAREIPEAMSAFRELDMSKAWFKGYTEEQLEHEITEFIKRTSYQYYFMCSDDMEPTKEVARLLCEQIPQYQILTGYCNMTPGSEKVNIRFKPFVGSYPFFVATHAIPPLAKLLERYKIQTFPNRSEVMAQPEVFRTYFMGYAFTGMERSLWLQYPPRPWKNHLTGKSFGSDYLICRQLNERDIPMWCHRDAFVYHLNSMENFIVGKVKPEVIHEP